MTLRGMTLLPLTFTFALAATLVAGVRKEAPPGPDVIASVPHVIHTPGIYRLVDDLCFESESGSAILIEADNVTIDLGGHRLSSTTGAGGRAVGVAANGHSALSIRNGTIQGFHFGVQVSGAGQDNQVRNVNFADNWYIGLWLEGERSLALNNRIENTGGCALADFTTPIGMRVVGEKCAVINNEVSGFSWCPGVTAEVVGVAIDAAPGAMVTGNAIRLDHFVKNSWGIWVNSTANDGSSSVEVESNVFTNLENGCAFLYAQGRMKNNCYQNVETRWRVPESNWDADQGGNVSVPAPHELKCEREAPAAEKTSASRYDSDKRTLAAR